MKKVGPGILEGTKLIELLENETLHLDELARITGIQTSEISARLTIMEMKGQVRSLGGGEYKRSL